MNTCEKAFAKNVCEKCGVNVFKTDWVFPFWMPKKRPFVDFSVFPIFISLSHFIRSRVSYGHLSVLDKNNCPKHALHHPNPKCAVSTLDLTTFGDLDTKSPKAQDDRSIPDTIHTISSAMLLFTVATYPGKAIDEKSSKSYRWHDYWPVATSMTYKQDFARYSES